MLRAKSLTKGDAQEEFYKPRYFHLSLLIPSVRNPGCLRCWSLITANHSSVQRSNIWYVYSTIQTASFSFHVLRSHALLMVLKSAAAGLEKGGVLRALVMALQKHIAFAELHEIPVQHHFPDFVIQLLSARPSVCADALDSFSSFLALVVQVLHSEFSRYSREKSLVVQHAGCPIATLRVRPTSKCDASFQLPLALLQSICVVLGIWSDQRGSNHELKESADLVSDLVDSLLQESHDDDSSGLASATVADSGAVAISVESVRPGISHTLETSTNRVSYPFSLLKIFDSG
jgi:hypothetical protein